MMLGMTSCNYSPFVSSSFVIGLFQQLFCPLLLGFGSFSLLTRRGVTDGFLSTYLTGPKASVPQSAERLYACFSVLLLEMEALNLGMALFISGRNSSFALFQPLRNTTECLVTTRGNDMTGLRRLALRLSSLTFLSIISGHMQPSDVPCDLG